MPADPAIRRRALETQLALRPMRNAHALVEPTTEGREIHVRVPLQYSAPLRLLRGWLSVRDHKTYALDPFSRCIWDLIDNYRTVGQIADALAQQQQLSFFEAYGLVTQFLAQLSRRGIIAMVAPDRTISNPVRNVAPV